MSIVKERTMREATSTSAQALSETRVPKWGKAMRPADLPHRSKVERAGARRPYGGDQVDVLYCIADGWVPAASH